MRRPRTTCTILLAFALCGVAGWTQPTREDRDFGSGALHRPIQWLSPSGEQTTSGLFLLDMTSARMVQRVLAQDAAARPIILTWVLDAQEGRESSEFLDDETGWWARLELDTGIQADYLGAYFAAAGQQLKPGHTLNMKLSTRDGLSFERRLAQTDAAVLPYQEFAASLVADGPAERLAARPPELIAAVFFLDAFMSQGPLQTERQDSHNLYNMRGIVEVLANVFRKQTSVSASETWKMTFSDLRQGVTITDSDLLELVSRFRSVENADPLSDHRAREVPRTRGAGRGW